MPENVIRPIDEIGTELIGREAGASFRERVVRSAQSGQVIVDLEGVDLISPSFADELFAKLPSELVAARRVRFLNASADVQALARGVRGLRAELATA